MVEQIVELTGTSTSSIEDAVALAVSRASVTLAGIREATITQTKALVEDGRVCGWKVTVKIAFLVQDQLHE